nr:uncharacterized protein LOC128704087 [Cherax quadricarinatus]
MEFKNDFNDEIKDQEQILNTVKSFTFTPEATDTKPTPTTTKKPFSDDIDFGHNIEIKIDKQDPQTLVDNLTKCLHKREPKEEKNTGNEVTLKDPLTNTDLHEHTHSTSEEQYYNQTLGQYDLPQEQCGSVAQEQQPKRKRGRPKKGSKESLQGNKCPRESLCRNISSVSECKMKLNVSAREENIKGKRMKVNRGGYNRRQEVSVNLNVKPGYPDNHDVHHFSDGNSQNLLNHDKKIHSEFAYDDSVAGTSKTPTQNIGARGSRRRHAYSVNPCENDDFNKQFKLSSHNTCISLSTSSLSLTPVSVDSSTSRVSGVDDNDFEGFELWENEIGCGRRHYKYKGNILDLIKKGLRKVRGRKSKSAIRKNKNKINVMKVGRKKARNMKKKTGNTAQKVTREKSGALKKIDNDETQNVLEKAERDKNTNAVVEAVGFKTKMGLVRKTKRKKKGTLKKKMRNTKCTSLSVDRESSIKDKKSKAMLMEKIKTRSNTAQEEHERVSKTKSDSLSKKQSDDHYYLPHRNQVSKVVSREDKSTQRETRSQRKAKASSIEPAPSNQLICTRKRELSPEIGSFSSWGVEHDISKNIKRKRGEVVVATKTEVLQESMLKKQLRTRKAIVMVPSETEMSRKKLPKKSFRARKAVVQPVRKMTRGRAKSKIQKLEIDLTNVQDEVKEEVKPRQEGNVLPSVAEVEYEVDEDLPDLTTLPLLKGKQTFQFKAGDLVWSMQRGAWWPSYVEQVYTHSKKASVYLIGSKQEADPKVDFSKIKGFNYGEIPSYVDRSTNGLSAALHLTESYCQLQKHGNNISVQDFFSLPPEDQDALIIVSLTPKEDPYLASSGMKRKCDDFDEWSQNSSSYYEMESPGSDVLIYRSDDEISLSSRDRKKLKSAMKARRRDNEKLLKFIQSPSCVNHLWQIFNGEKTCERNDLYQDELTRRTLLWSGIGPFQLDKNDEQILAVIDFLSIELEKKRPDFHQIHDYVVKVWMPEAIKEALRVVRKVPESELELALQEGYRETPTEKKARRLDFT